MFEVTFDVFVNGALASTIEGVLCGTVYKKQQGSAGAANI